MITQSVYLVCMHSFGSSKKKNKKEWKSSSARNIFEFGLYLIDLMSLLIKSVPAFSLSGSCAYGHKTNDSGLPFPLTKKESDHDSNHFDSMKLIVNSRCRTNMEFQTTQNDCLHRTLILIKLSNFRFIPIPIELFYERKKSYQCSEGFFFWLKIHPASIFCA